MDGQIQNRIKNRAIELTKYVPSQHQTRVREFLEDVLTGLSAIPDDDRSDTDSELIDIQEFVPVTKYDDDNIPICTIEDIEQTQYIKKLKIVSSIPEPEQLEQLEEEPVVIQPVVVIKSITHFVTEYDSSNIDAKDLKGFTRLHRAVMTLNVKQVRILLRKGAHSNIRDESGLTARDRAKFRADDGDSKEALQIMNLLK